MTAQRPVFKGSPIRAVASDEAPVAGGALWHGAETETSLVHYRGQMSHKEFVV